jgi:hypothetical protein
MAPRKTLEGAMEGDDDAADGDVVVGRAMTWVRSCLRRVQVGVCID